MKKILIVFGTRPEAIKMAPLIKEFGNYQNIFNTKVCVTAQHREMLDQVLDFFGIIPDFDLNLMTPDQDLFSLTSHIITEFKEILEKFEPDYVFVHGDTTTSMATSLASFYFGTKICHVEAGLRTFDKKSPFPEEINRQITSRIADYHFAPTQNSKDNLLKENIGTESIVITGNTVIDALFESIVLINKNIKPLNSFLDSICDLNKEIIIVTGHRRENHGEGIQIIAAALKEIAKIFPNIEIVYPVHPNPKVQNPVYELLSGIENIKLIDPLPYEAFILLLNKSKLVITDSGGIQEEAPSLGKPVLVMRDKTERPEAVDSGTVLLVGTDKKKIVNQVSFLLKNQKAYSKMSKLHNPYGDGKASERIVSFINNL